jgi:REP element-mobilizing transposase RayT
MSDKFQNKYRIKSARLAGYDYRNEGYYFITICTKNREHFFGKCENGTMALNDLGKIAENFWLEIPSHFPNVSLDEFTIMPNHVHGIICIDKKIEIERVSVETLHATSDNIEKTLNAPDNHVKTLHATSLQGGQYGKISPKQGSLSAVLRSFKSTVSNKIKPINPNFAWQPRFHDHIIRDLQSFINIQKYIKNNPANWKNDEHYL